MTSRLNYAQWLSDNETLRDSENSVDNEKYQTILDAYEISGGGEKVTTEDLKSKPSNIPTFNLARTSGLTKGYFDQASGIAQIAERFKTGPDSRKVALMRSAITGSPKAADIKIPSVDEYIQKEEKEYQLARKESGDTGIDWSRMAGNIVNPVSIGTMAILPAAGATLPAKIGTSALAGSAALGSHPVTEDVDNFGRAKATQLVSGGLIGGVVPPAMVPLKGAFDVVKYLARPFNKAGQLADLKKVYLGLAGDARTKIIHSLENATTHIKGSKPTSGQAIAEGAMKLGDDGLPQNFGGSIAKLEQGLAKKMVTGDALKTVYGKQAARRSNAISNLVDSGDDALVNALSARTNATKPFYDIVEKSTKSVNPSKVLAAIEKHLIINKNQTSVTVPLKDIQKMIVASGKPETSPQALHSLSKHIGNLMSKKTPGGQNEFDVKVLSDIKKVLDTQIGKAEPAYKMAHKVHKQYSEPVNQIEVSRELGRALENAVKEESPTPFLRAIEDAPKLLKKSTGFARYNKLSDVMNGTQIKEITKVKQELLRQAKERNLARNTESVTAVLEGQIEPTLPNLLSRPMMMANFVLRKVGEGMGPKYERLAIEIQKNPKQLIKILELPADNPRRKATEELLARFSGMIPAQGVAPEIAREF